MSAPRPYVTDPFRTYSSVPLTVVRVRFRSIYIREYRHCVLNVVDLFDTHAHLLNITKGTKQSLFKHKQSKNNRKLYSLVFFCPNNKKYNKFKKSSVSPVNSLCTAAPPLKKKSGRGGCTQATRK